MIDKDFGNLIYILIGKKIKALREQAEYNQEDIATGIKVSRASIANYESGKQAIYIDDLYRVADFFKVEVHSLLPSLEEIRSQSLPEKVLDTATNLKMSEKQEIKDFIKKVQS
jgi:transcriptional regulator with XRE-family HTH domain